MGWKKKEEKTFLKNRISAATERRREIHVEKQPKKRPDLGEGGGRVYVLFCMSVTSPTCQVERSPMKEPATQNTAPQRQKKKGQEKKGVGK